MKPLILLLALFLTGCATLEKQAGSTSTFAACKTADVITTKIALNSGKFFEANKFLSVFIGPHNFTPLVLFSVAAYIGLNMLDDKRVTMAANVITCGVAARNMLLLHNAGIMH